MYFTISYKQANKHKNTNTHTHTVYIISITSVGASIHIILTSFLSFHYNEKRFTSVLGEKIAITSHDKMLGTKSVAHSK